MYQSTEVHIMLYYARLHNHIIICQYSNKQIAPIYVITFMMCDYQTQIKDPIWTPKDP